MTASNTLYKLVFASEVLYMYFSYSEASSHKTRRREFVMTHIKAWLAEFLGKKVANERIVCTALLA